MKRLFLVTILFAPLITSCAKNPRALLSEYAGINLCKSARASLNRQEQPDVLSIYISDAQRRCNPSIETSIVSASGPGCIPLLKQGACSYEYKDRTIAVRRNGPDRGGYYEVRIW